jgi:hypothetical protein
VFTIRNTLKKPKQMARNVIMAYVGVGVMFAIMGTSFYLTYGDEGLLQSSFDYFPRSGSALGYS